MDAPVVWHSEDKLVFQVDAGGEVTPVALGRAVVTAMSGNVSDQATVKVRHEGDWQALEAIYHATQGDLWVHNEGWLTNLPVTGWSPTPD